MTIGEVFGLVAYSGSTAALILIILVTIIGGDLLERAMRRWTCDRVGHKHRQSPGTFYYKCERCSQTVNIRTQKVTVE